MKLELVVIADVVVVADIPILAIGSLILHAEPHVARYSLPRGQFQVEVVVSDRGITQYLRAVEIERRAVAIAAAEFARGDAHERRARKAILGMQPEQEVLVVVARDGFDVVVVQ